MSRTAWVLALAVALVGCKEDKPKPAAPTASATSSATALKTASAPKVEHDWCKDFIAALEVCAKNPPAGSSAEAYQKQVETQRGAYEKAGTVEKSQMQSGCLTGLKTLEQQTPGCGAKPSPSATAE